MPSYRRVTQMIAASLLAPGFALAAAKPAAKAPPWRPFPGMSEILYFDDFEVQAQDQKVNVDGSYKSEMSAPGGKFCFQPKQGDKNKKATIMKIKIVNTKADFPDGMKTKDIAIGFQYYSSEFGTLFLKVRNGKKEFRRKLNVSRTKRWMPMSVKLSEFQNRGRVDDKDKITEIEIRMEPRQRKEFPQTYVDDVVVTHRLDPALAAARLRVWKRMSAAVKRTPDKDGFFYDMNTQTRLTAAFRANRTRAKASKVLVVGAADNNGLLASLRAAAKTLKARYTFEAVKAPDGSPLRGIDHMRALLPHQLAKTSAGTVILIFHPQDALRPGRSGRHLRVIVRRVLERGALPVVALPPAQGGNPRVKNFNTDIKKACESVGVPYVDGAHVLKGMDAPVQAGLLTDAAVKKLAENGIQAAYFANTKLRRR